MTIRSSWVLVAGLTACLGGGGAASDSTAGTPSGDVGAVTVQNGGSAFTAIRPLHPGDTAPPRPTTEASSGLPRDTGLTISITYDGTPARIVITTPDGRVINDTTRPRDTSCDNFAPDTSSDPNADGIGCNPESYGMTVASSRPGVAYIQVTAADSGEISLGVEGLVQRNYVVGSWGVRVLRLQRGQTHIFRLILNGRREDGPIRAFSLTGPVDTNVVAR